MGKNISSSLRTINGCEIPLGAIFELISTCRSGCEAFVSSGNRCKTVWTNKPWSGVNRQRVDGVTQGFNC